MASLSGSNAISGLGGYDTDFDSVLANLKKIEMTKINKLEAWKSDWQLRYDAFGEVIDQVQAASSVLSSLTDKNNFVKKLVTSSNSNIITAVANASAQDVQHTINVSQMASNAIWANTGHVFSSKDEVIATEATDFTFSYAGKEHSIAIGKNTTLESFASIVNNSKDNPGIKVSIVNAGNGYVFQVAGKDTGVENDLVIQSNPFLKGLDATGKNSTWISDSLLDTTQSLTNPTKYVIDLVLQNGGKKSIDISGAATADELVTALNNASGVINARLDASGNLLMDGVRSYSVRANGEQIYSPAGVKAYAGSDINKALLGPDSTDELECTVTLQNGKTRTFYISGSATTRDLLGQLGRVNGDDVEISLDGSKGWNIKLDDVADIKFANKATGDPVDLDFFSTVAYEAKGTLVPSTSSMDTTLTFDKDKLSEKLTTASTPKAMRYTVVMADGSAQYIDFTADEASTATYGDLLAKAKALPGASVDPNDENKVKLSGVQSFRLTTGNGGMSAVSVSTTSQTTVAQGDAFYVDPVTGQATLEKAPDLTYSILKNDGASVDLTYESGITVKELFSRLKAELGDTVTIADADGNEWDGVSDGQFFLQFNNVQSAKGVGFTGQTVASDNWSIQRSSNAIYTIDNWPVVMESSSNTISDAIEGVIVNIQDTGDAKISVSTDITSVETSIQNFLDAVNSVIITMNSLMAYDEDKQVTTNDPDKKGEANYSASGLTSEKGGLLMGNYGVQLLKSRLNSAVTSSPAGFNRRTDASDVLSGDLISSLSSMGIKTDTDSTSSTYGLLVIAPSSAIGELQNMDKATYTDMITNHLDDVVNFFCASGVGSTDTSDFRYGSHIEGITKAGTYDVTYTVDDDGNISKVMVGGVEAKRDETQPGNYYSVASGDARGLSILIDDLKAGDHSGKVSIKQGLVQTVSSFLKDELTYTNVSVGNSVSDDSIALKSKNGALMILRDNYKNIMNNIDKSIEKEQLRVSTWEKRQKAIFANLETLLKTYSEQESRLKAQISSLSSSSSK